MNKAFVGTLAVMLLLCVGAKNAASIAFTDNYNPADVRLNHYGASYSFTHDITDDKFQLSTHNIVSATIALQFHDFTFIRHYWD